MPILPKSKRLAWQAERKPQERRLIDNTAFYNSPRWRALSKAFKANNPICCQCEHEATYYTDHIQPINEGGAMWDINNLQPLCVRCHAKKSGREAHTKNKQ